MTPTEFKKLKAEYLTNLKISQIELGALDPRTKYSAEGTVNAAKQKLERLRPEVIGLILANSTTVYVDAEVDLSSQLKEITSSNDNVTTVDFLALEKKIMKDIYPPRTHGFPFNADVVNRINNSMLDIRTLIGASFIPSVTATASQYKVLGNETEALANLSSVLERTYGNELKTLVIAKQINEFVDKQMKEYDKMVFFVLNFSGNTKGLEGITGKTVNITKDDPVPEDSAGVQLLITNKLKKNNKKSLTQSET